jgi:hypothetical protein
MLYLCRRNIMVDAPSEEEIADMLDSLNRVSSAPLLTADTAAAKKKGVDNYVKWFRERGIAVYQDKNEVWKFGVPPRKH